MAGKDSDSRSLMEETDGKGEGKELGAEALQASPKSYDLGAGEEAGVPHPSEQFLRAATVPGNVLRLEQALSTSGRMEIRWGQKAKG